MGDLVWGKWRDYTGNRHFAVCIVRWFMLGSCRYIKAGVFPEPEFLQRYLFNIVALIFLSSALETFRWNIFFSSMAESITNSADCLNFLENFRLAYSIQSHYTHRRMEYGDSSSALWKVSLNDNWVMYLNYSMMVVW